MGSVDTGQRYEKLRSPAERGFGAMGVFLVFAGIMLVWWVFMGVMDSWRGSRDAKMQERMERFASYKKKKEPLYKRKRRAKGYSVKY